MATAQAGVVTLSHVSGKGNLTVSGIITAQAGVTSITHISALGNLTVSGLVNARMGITTPTHISTAGKISVGGTVDGVDIGVHSAGSVSGMHGLACTSGGTVAVATCGTYIGTGSGKQIVMHNLGRYFAFLAIQSQGSGYHIGRRQGPPSTQLDAMCAEEFLTQGSFIMSADSFVVGDTYYPAAEMLNASGVTYLWFAIG
jgi:hypothetical protein